MNYEMKVTVKINQEGQISYELTDPEGWTFHAQTLSGLANLTKDVAQTWKEDLIRIRKSDETHKLMVLRMAQKLIESA